MKNAKIIDTDVKFQDYILDVDQQKQVKQLLPDNQDAVSQNSGVGQTNMKAEFDLSDNLPFFI